MSEGNVMSLENGTKISMK